MGLLPYVFTGSSHLSFTLSLALPLWIGRVLYRLVSQFNLNMAHLVPEGTPGALISLIVLIERVRLLIRPVALAVRLAATILAANRTASATGRIKSLTLSINTIKEISAPGVPSGTKWAIFKLNCDTSLYNTLPIHKGRAKLKVKLR